MQQIEINKTKTPKVKPDADKLGFGKHFSDHMFIMDYIKGEGWINPRIVPYGPFTLDPSCMVFHYAQEVFEGMKAYRGRDGKIRLFRPIENIRRMNNSCARMCVPEIGEDIFMQALCELIKVDHEWTPGAPNTSLYIRPFVIATEPHVGVHASERYIFCIITSPVGSYYAAGLSPVRIMIESEDVRAVRGGTGFAKCGGNYAASLRAGGRAEELGFNQVLWLDGVERKYVEEVGSMNVMFKINGTIITPELNGSVLPGITRKSCLEILKGWGYETEERRVSVRELITAADKGGLEEAWGTGTAAVVSPIGEISYETRKYCIADFKIGEITQKLYDYLTGIQWGIIDDPYGWTVEVC